VEPEERIVRAAEEGDDSRFDVRHSGEAVKSFGGPDKMGLTDATTQMPPRTQRSDQSRALAITPIRARLPTTTTEMSMRVRTTGPRLSSSRMGFPCEISRPRFANVTSA
jgi:hypothetical protein